MRALPVVLVLALVVALCLLLGAALSAWADGFGERRRATRRARNRLRWSCVTTEPDQRKWCWKCYHQATYWPCEGNENSYLWRPRPVVNQNYEPVE